jgi:hypothetical protein
MTTQSHLVAKSLSYLQAKKYVGEVKKFADIFHSLSNYIIASFGRLVWQRLILVPETATDYGLSLNKTFSRVKHDTDYHTMQMCKYCL